MDSSATQSLQISSSAFLIYFSEMDLSPLVGRYPQVYNSSSCNHGTPMRPAGYALLCAVCRPLVPPFPPTPLEAGPSVAEFSDG